LRDYSDGSFDRPTYYRTTKLCLEGSSYRLILQGLLEAARMEPLRRWKRSSINEATRKLLDAPIEELGLPKRIYEVLKENNIRFIGEVIRRHLLDLPGFGHGSLRVTKKALERLGLWYFMNLHDWQPPL